MCRLAEVGDRFLIILMFSYIHIGEKNKQQQQKKLVMPYKTQSSILSLSLSVQSTT